MKRRGEGRKVKVVNREGKVKMRRRVEGVEWGGGKSRVKEKL